jgi:hypothetical protein
MKKIIVFILLIFNWHGINAQNFERLFHTEFDSYATDVIQINHSYFVASIHVFEKFYPFENSTSELLKLDLNGNITKSLKFDFLNNHVKINKLIRVDDDIFLHGINSIDAYTFSQKAFIARIDTNLNIKYLQNYFIENVPFNIVDVVDYDSSNFLMYYLPGYPYYLALINKNNGSIELKTQKDYPFFSLIHLKNKNKIHLYPYNSFSFPFLSYDNTTFTIIDSVNFSSLNQVSKSKLMINDSTYFIASEYLKNTPPNYPDACWDFSIIKVNDSLNNITDFVYVTYPNTLSHKIAYNNALSFCQSDSNIIYYGGTYNFSLPEPTDFIKESRRFELLKIDRNGYFIDRKIFSNNNENYSLVMESLTATSDGGCIMVGWFWDYSQDNPVEKRSIYILKVDSLGNYNPSLNITKINQNPLIHLFPNPNSSRMMNITGIKGDETIFIYTIHGQLLKKIQAQNSLDLSDFSKGTYIFSIHSSNGDFIKNEKVILN